MPPKTPRQRKSSKKQRNQSGGGYLSSVQAEQQTTTAKDSQQLMMNGSRDFLYYHSAKPTTRKSTSNTNIMDPQQIQQSKSSFDSVMDREQAGPRGRGLGVRSPKSPIYRNSENLYARRMLRHQKQKRPAQSDVSERDRSDQNKSSQPDSSQKMKFKLKDVYFPSSLGSGRNSSSFKLLDDYKRAQKLGSKIYGRHSPANVKSTSSDASSVQSNGLQRKVTAKKIPFFQLEREFRDKDLFGFGKELNPEQAIEKQKDLVRRSLLQVDEEQIGPIRQFISENLIVSTSNVAYQSWKILILFLSFASAFYYVYLLTFNGVHPDREKAFLIMSIIVEALFGIDIALTFFVEHYYEASDQVERDVVRLAYIYIKGSFFLDLITIVPFRVMFQWITHSELLWLLKLLRLYNGFHLLNNEVLTREIKAFQRKRIKRILESTVSLAQSQNVDITNLRLISLVKYLSRIAQLIIILVCLSVLSGMLWWKFVDVLEHDFQIDGFIHTFFTNYIPERDNADQGRTVLVTVTYFMFTTLSTVGLGDYYPYSNAERILGCFLFLFGVLTTSYVIQGLTEITIKLRHIDQDYDESDSLSHFLTVMSKFNENSSLPPVLSRSIESYFKYRWKHNRNNAIETKQEKDLLDQLPKSVQRSIYIDFLFSSFLTIYSPSLGFEHFELQRDRRLVEQKLKIRIDNNVFKEAFSVEVIYSKQSDPYRQMLVTMLKYMEPKYVSCFETIYSPDAQVDEAVFFQGGVVKVGYRKILLKSSQKIDVSQYRVERSQDFNFPVFITPGSCAIGLFEMIYQMPSQFWYRMGKSRDEEIHCLFIRRLNMTKILSESIDLGLYQKNFKLRTLFNYLNKVHVPMLQDQNLILSHRELYKDKLREYFLTKIEDMEMQIIEENTKDYEFFKQKLKKGKNLDEQKMRELLFIELQKYPELKNKFAGLIFPTKGTVMRRASNKSLSRNGTKIRNQQYFHNLKDPVISLMLKELGVKSHQIQREVQQELLSLSSSVSGSETSSSDFKSVISGSSRNKSSPSKKNSSSSSRHSSKMSRGSRSGSSSRASRNTKGTRASRAHRKHYKKDLFSIMKRFQRKVKDHDLIANTILDKYSQMSEMVASQRKMISLLTQEIQYKDSIIKRQSEQLSKFHRDDLEDKSMRSLFSSLNNTTNPPHSVVPNKEEENSFSNLVRKSSNNLIANLSSSALATPNENVHIDDISLQFQKQSDFHQESSDTNRGRRSSNEATKQSADQTNESKEQIESKAKRRQSLIQNKGTIGSFGVLSRELSGVASTSRFKKPDDDDQDEETEGFPSQTTQTKKSPFFVEDPPKIEFKEEEQKFGSFHEFDSSDSENQESSPKPLSKKKPRGSISRYSKEFKEDEMQRSIQEDRLPTKKLEILAKGPFAGKQSTHAGPTSKFTLKQQTTKKSSSKATEVGSHGKNSLGRWSSAKQSSNALHSRGDKCCLDKSCPECQSMLSKQTSSKQNSLRKLHSRTPDRKVLRSSERSKEMKTTPSRASERAYDPRLSSKSRQSTDRQVVEPVIVRNETLDSDNIAQDQRFQLKQKRSGLASGLTDVSPPLNPHLQMKISKPPIIPRNKSSTSKAKPPKPINRRLEELTESSSEDSDDGMASSSGIRKKKQKTMPRPSDQEEQKQQTKVERSRTSAVHRQISRADSDTHTSVATINKRQITEQYTELEVVYEDEDDDDEFRAGNEQGSSSPARAGRDDSGRRGESQDSFNQALVSGIFSNSTDGIVYEE